MADQPPPATPTSFTPFGDRLDLHARETPEKTAIIIDDEALTYAELQCRARQCARALLAAGCSPGQTGSIGFIANNRMNFVIGACAGMVAGVCLAPISTMIGSDAQARMLADADVRVLFTSEDCRASAEQALALADPERRILCVGLDFEDERWRGFDAFLAGHNTDPLDITVQPDWQANLIYSSGTTGLPKGIIHSHAVRSGQNEVLRSLGLDRDTQLIQAVSLYSNHGLSAMALSIWWGALCLMMRKFDAGQMMDFYRRYRPTLAWIVPAVLLRCLAREDLEEATADKPSLKLCAGAPLTADQKRDTLRRWSGPFIEAYGQTETGVVSLLQVDKAPDSKLGSVGKAGSANFVRIIDAEGCEAPTGQVGEIAAHTPTLLSEYHNRPEETAQAFWYDHEGRRYMRTGDLGSLDEDGYLWLADRKKDMIISGGYNIYAADIEKVLLDHPAVFEVAVIGVPSERWGESPIAVATLVEGATARAEDLCNWANARLGKVQRLAWVDIASDLPRGALGKILKRELRKHYGEAGRTAP